MITTKVRAFLSGRLLFAVLAVSLVTITANAYTIVMRDGRRIEVPASFAVTQTTLTYEVSPSIQVTLQLAVVDIPGTEFANKETAGSFMARVKRSQVLETKVAIARSGSVTAKRQTITNRDLENFRLARIESEETYERRRVALGLPSIEEVRQRTALQTDETVEAVRQIRARQEDSEDYWQSRASALRAELAATSARISFLQGRLNDIPLPFSTGAFVSVLPLVTSGRFAVGNGARPTVMARPRVFTAPAAGPRIGFADRLSRRQGFVNNGPFHAARRFPLPVVSPFPGVGALSLPFLSSDYSVEGPELGAELNQLLAYRAGLESNWRELEDEARRAGASPGWLRP